MSGGFFRGTSADQDTRFSNKMSKLLKTQKFAPELDVIIEMAKVKMDVIRPWIATRVTELLGFEDEVLINFIYGLLDVKEADGKHLQIQLTGFMEKNTGRFMKELWSLLTSAQNNISGIPQQFLDAKAEEAKKKKDEKERILSEVQRKKEEQEKDAEERKEQERLRKLSTPQEPTKRSDSVSPGRRGGGDAGGHGGKKGRSMRRPSVSTRGSGSSSSSPSRSPPVRRRRSRSISRSPRRRRRSGSPYRRRSPLVPRSPPRRRRSPVYSRSPPRRRKSPPPRPPPRHRSRTPPRMRMRSPLDGLSPPRRHVGGPRSSPLRRRSSSVSVSPPVARRSPSRSPYSKGRSPSKDRAGRRSRSPFQRRKSPSRHRGPRASRSPYQRRRSPSRDREFGVPANRSPYRRRRSPGRDYGGGRRNGFDVRDRERPARDGERLERRNDRVEKGDHAEQRPLYTREQERLSSRDGRDAGRPSDSLITGEKRSHDDLEEDVELGTTKREEPGLQVAEVARTVNKVASSIRGQADGAAVGAVESKRAGEKKESVAGPTVESDDEEQEPAARPQKITTGVKDVVDVGEEEEGSESPGSSEERHEAKRRRKEEKRLRKEEKRRRREEKHRRKEEKRAAKSSKAGVDEDDDCGVLDGRLQKEDDEQHSSREVFGPKEVYRKKDDETEDEQRRIEKELRNKALESLRAKKGIAC